MVTYENGGLRQHELSKSVEVTFNLVFVPPRKVGHVGNQRHFCIIGRNFGYHANIFRIANKANLDGADGHIFKHRARLLANRFFVETDMVKNFRCVAHIRAGNDCKRMSTSRRNGGDVSSQATCAAGIARIERHDAYRCFFNLWQ